jgi:zinc/manganese transport system permease protein
MFAGFMVNTWIVASVVGVVAGVVGFFVVLRGSSFAAHAVPNAAFAGAAGANLVGASSIGGLLVFALAGALGISLLSRRGRRDVATALAVVLMLALGALFLSFSTEYASEAYSLLFGEVLGVSSSELLPTAALALCAVVAVALCWRLLLLTSIVPELAQARGVRTHRVEMVFLLIVAVVTTMSVPVVGALLIFSLMIGPPAAARSFTANPFVAVLLAVCFALAAVWTAIAVSYVTTLPIGFFVGVLGAAFYLAGRAYAVWNGSRVASASPSVVRSARAASV